MANIKKFDLIVSFGEKIMGLRWDKIKHFNDKQFRRMIGVKKEVFLVMQEVVHAHATSKKSLGGRPNALSIEDQLLLLLGYYKEYMPLIIIGGQYGISESTASRIIREIEEVLMGSGRFSLAGKKDCLNTKHGHLLIDVTETPIERPKKKYVEEFAIFRKNFIQGRRKDIL